MSKTKQYVNNSVMIYPPLSNAFFPTTLGYLNGRTDQVSVDFIKLRVYVFSATRVRPIGLRNVALMLRALTSVSVCL